MIDKDFFRCEKGYVTNLLDLIATFSFSIYLILFNHTCFPSRIGGTRLLLLDPSDYSSQSAPLDSYPTPLSSPSRPVSPFPSLPKMFPARYEAEPQQSHFALSLKRENFQDLVVRFSYISVHFHRLLIRAAGSSVRHFPLHLGDWGMMLSGISIV